MKAPYNQAPRVMPPAGTFIARVVRIIYIGTVKTINTFQGGIEQETPKIHITWELPTEKHVFKEGEPEKPFLVSREFTHSMGKKSTLRPITEAILGVSLTDEEAYAFDHDELLGLSCQVTIIHDEKESGTWEKVNSVSALLKGVVCPPPVNDMYVLSYEKWNEELFQKLPPFLKKKMEGSKEYKAMRGIKSEISTDDIPF